MAKVCDTVSEVAVEAHEGWAELVPFLFQCVQSGQPGLMESALVIFSTLASYITDSLIPQLPNLVQVRFFSLASPHDTLLTSLI